MFQIAAICLVVLLPFQQIWDIGPATFYFFYGAFAVIALATLPHKKHVLRDPMVVCLALLVGLTLLHAGDGSPASVKTVVISLLAAACYLIGKNVSPLDAETAIASAIVLGVALSAIYVYVPVPGMFGPQDPPNMRLSGIVENPNRLGKLIPFALLAVLALPSRLSVRWAAVVFLAVALGATESKAAIAGTLVGVLMLGTVRQRLRNALAVGLAISVWFALPVERWATERWLEIPLTRFGLHDELEEHLAEMRAGNYSPLRLGKSARMYEFNSRIFYEEADSSLLSTGQRGKLWAAGADVIKEHWLWGVGPNGWQKEMKLRVGASLETPHNGFLEVWGALGIGGAILFIATYAFALRRASGWPLAVVACMFAIELVDVAILTGYHNVTLMLWFVLGVSAGPRTGIPGRLQSASNVTNNGRTSE